MPDPGEHIRLISFDISFGRLAWVPVLSGIGGNYYVSGYITTYPVSYALQYRALSYMWGDETATHTILLNGRRFDVTENLFQFLLQHVGTRTEENNIHIWVDAICTNQENAMEKGAQVQMMGQTYADAECRIIWLGSPKSMEVWRTLDFMGFPYIDLGTQSLKDEWKSHVMERQLYDRLYDLHHRGSKIRLGNGATALTGIMQPES